MSRVRNLARETIVYGISSIIGRMLSWLLVPLYTQFLAPEDYGIVTELYAYVAFLVIIYTYGMETAFFRFATKDANESKKIFENAQTSILLTSLSLSLLLIVFASPIINFLEYPGKEKYVIWFSVILAIDAIVAIPFARLRLNGEAKKFAVAKMLNILINIGLNLFFIVVCLQISRGNILPDFKNIVGNFFSESDLVDYIFLSNLVANAFLIVLLWGQFINFRFRFDWSLLKPIYVYAFPLLIMGLAGEVNEMLSRAMLKKWLPDNFYPDYSNQAALGIFGAAYKLSVFMSLAIQAYRYAAEPFFFKQAKDTDSKQLFSKVMHWFIISGCVVFLLVSLNLDIIGNLFLRSPLYREGLYVVPVLLLAYLFFGIYFNLSAWYKITDKTYIGTIISVAGAIVTIILNLVLIPVAGYLGSSVVTLICFVFMSILSFILGQRYYPIPYAISKGIFYILISSGLVLAGNYIIIGSPIIQKVFQVLIFVVFIILILFSERKELKMLFKIQK